jgi:hypothetical protein
MDVYVCVWSGLCRAWGVVCASGMNMGEAHSGKNLYIEKLSKAILDKEEEESFCNLELCYMH